MAGQPRQGYDAVIAALTEAKTALLFLHINADGDSVGSTLALAQALERRGATCWLTYGDRFPEPYRFLPGADRLQPWQTIAPDLRFDLAILPDCSDVDRVGAAVKLLAQAAQVVNIDHHPSNRGFGDVRWLDPTRSCVGEMVLEIIDGLGVPIDAAIATCLYTAIMTDTGSFAFESTTARTHRYAARLLEHGAKPHVIAREVYGKISLRSLRLLGEVLAGLEVSADGRVAWIRISRELRARHGAGPHDCEGFVNYPRNLAGVEIALAFYEEDDGSVRVAFRSTQYADVSQLAAEFGGGGHRRAAGCRHRGPLEQAVREIVARASSYVAEPSVLSGAARGEG